MASLLGAGATWQAVGVPSPMRVIRWGTLMLSSMMTTVEWSSALSEAQAALVASWTLLAMEGAEEVVRVAADDAPVGGAERYRGGRPSARARDESTWM